MAVAVVDADCSAADCWVVAAVAATLVAVLRRLLVADATAETSVAAADADCSVASVVLAAVAAIAVAVLQLRLAAVATAETLAAAVVDC